MYKCVNAIVLEAYILTMWHWLSLISLVSLSFHCVWATYLCTWPPGISPLVLPPSQEVGSAWVSLSLVGCTFTGKGVFQRNPQFLPGIWNIRTWCLSNNTHTLLLSIVVAHHNSPPHTLWGCAGELAAAMTAAATTILGDAAVTSPFPKWPKMYRVGR